jgi:hypothetical protein
LVSRDNGKGNGDLLWSSLEDIEVGVPVVELVDRKTMERNETSYIVSQPNVAFASFIWKR